MENNVSKVPTLEALSEVIFTRFVIRLLSTPFSTFWIFWRRELYTKRMQICVIYFITYLIYIFPGNMTNYIL